MKKLKMAAMMVASFSGGMLANSATASAALGFCYEPSPPSAYLRKPTKPFCAAGRSCSDWEVNSYRNEVDSYYRKLRSYAGDIDTYYSDATDYVACMSKLD